MDSLPPRSQTQGIARGQREARPVRKVRVAHICHFELLEEALQLPIECKRRRLPTTVGLELVVKDVEAEQIFDLEMGLEIALQFACAKEVKARRRASPAGAWMA